MADLDRLKKLLALATNNPNEEEARSAALKFCKLFVAEKLPLDVPSDNQTPVKPFTTQPTKWQTVTVDIEPNFYWTLEQERAAREHARRQSQPHDYEWMRQQQQASQFAQFAAQQNAYARTKSEPPPKKEEPVVEPPPPPLSMFKQFLGVIFNRNLF